jgi:hypothetical protein
LCKCKVRSLRQRFELENILKKINHITQNYQMRHNQFFHFSIFFIYFFFLQFWSSLQFKNIYSLYNIYIFLEFWQSEIFPSTWLIQIKVDKMARREEQSLLGRSRSNGTSIISKYMTCKIYNISCINDKNVSNLQPKIKHSSLSILKVIKKYEVFYSTPRVHIELSCSSL